MWQTTAINGRKEMTKREELAFVQKNKKLMEKTITI